MMLRSLSHDEVAAVMEVVVGPGGTRERHGPAWTPVRRLALFLGAEGVSALVVAGWLEEWCEDPDGCSVTLTPEAAAVLGVELDERGADEVPVWVPAGESDHPVRLTTLSRRRPLPMPFGLRPAPAERRRREPRPRRPQPMAPLIDPILAALSRLPRRRRVAAL